MTELAAEQLAGGPCLSGRLRHGFNTAGKRPSSLAAPPSRSLHHVRKDDAAENQHCDWLVGLQISYVRRLGAYRKLRVLRGSSEQLCACGYKRGVAGPNEMQQYGGRIQKGRKTGEAVYAKNTCTDNYGALYCKVRTLRLDFAWEAAIAVDQSGGFGCRLYRSSVSRSNITPRTLLVSL